MIDHNLITEVIVFIHLRSPKDEAILVFLPGYKEIMDQKILIERQFNSMHWDDFQLILLHSNIEQNNVFERMPEGVRKIILSTNIAETSITIDDVVHVIDVGMVKQQSFNPVHGSMCLSTTIISKACAKQRTGRAGRTRNGFCYRLYSVEQYESMADYTTPEIKRVALTEMCLKAKMLAPNQPIMEFFQKAIDSPTKSHLLQSIHFLKEINALDSNEGITNLGYHLAHMPVDCQLGKMVLYAILFKCLDPILTIVSALSMKEPFLMPSDAESRAKINKVRLEFANNALSDHQMLLGIYAEWQTNDYSRKFCTENFISYANMDIIRNTRKLLKRHLDSGKYIGDETSINDNALKWNVIKACIVAGGSRKN